MKRNWKQKNEIKIRKNISVLMDELNAFEQRMDERLTDEMGKISSIEQQVNQILPILNYALFFRIERISVFDPFNERVLR